MYCSKFLLIYFLSGIEINDDNDNGDQDFIGNSNIIDLPDSSGVWLACFGFKISNVEKNELLEIGNSIGDNIVDVATRLITNYCGLPAAQVRRRL
jgi:hypothetical protein